MYPPEPRSFFSIPPTRQERRQIARGSYPGVHESIRKKEDRLTIAFPTASARRFIANFLRSVNTDTGIYDVSTQPSISLIATLLYKPLPDPPLLRMVYLKTFQQYVLPPYYMGLSGENGRFSVRKAITPSIKRLIFLGVPVYYMVFIDPSTGDWRIRVGIWQRLVRHLKGYPMPLLSSIYFLRVKPDVFTKIYLGDKAHPRDWNSDIFRETVGEQFDLYALTVPEYEQLLKISSKKARFKVAKDLKIPHAVRRGLNYRSSEVIRTR